MNPLTGLQAGLAVAVVLAVGGALFALKGYIEDAAVAKDRADAEQVAREAAEESKANLQKLIDYADEEAKKNEAAKRALQRELDSLRASRAANRAADLEAARWAATPVPESERRLRRPIGAPGPGNGVGLLRPGEAPRGDARPAPQ